MAEAEIGCKRRQQPQAFPVNHLFPTGVALGLEVPIAPAEVVLYMPFLRKGRLPGASPLPRKVQSVITLQGLLKTIIQVCACGNNNEQYTKQPVCLPDGHVVFL